MSFTPFDCLVVGEKTLAGLLQKDTHEVDLMVVDNVELRSGNVDPMVPLTAQHQIDSLKATKCKWVDRRGSLSVQLTTHRVVFWTMGKGDREARFLHHSQIHTVSPETALFRTPKLLISTAALGELFIVFGKDQARLRDDFATALSKALTRQEWEHDDQRSKVVRRAPGTTRRVGVDAIISSNNMRHQQAAKLTDTAFTGDVETLLKEAKELVLIINKYVATLDREKETNQDEDTRQLMDLLQNMGMTSALSKADYKGREDAYLDQVARELADFMRPRFSPTQPVLTLTDVYCLFNRARGSHLLSPEDIVNAAMRCRELHLGLSVTTFPSGLKVFQDDRWADPAMVAGRLEQLLADGKYTSLTAMDVSRAWHVSAVLATEQLQAVERAGHLVRDETLESIRFYPNRFNEWYNMRDRLDTNNR